MKKLIVLKIALIIVVMMPCVKVFSQSEKQPVKRNDTIICLRVTGKANEKGSAVDGVNVTLYKENEEMEWEEITSVQKHEHNFTFDLYANAYYTIKITKDGYNPRSISITTNLPDNFLLDYLMTFEFDVEMKPTVKGANDYYNDFPIAIISFNQKTLEFENHSRYTKHIKDKLGESDADDDDRADGKERKRKK